MDALIHVSDLHFAYGDHVVLDGMSADIHRGEVVVLLGPNGTGKTTLVELIMGSLAPHAGSIRTLGRDPRTQHGAWFGEIGLVIQHYSDHGKWTVNEFMAWICGHYVKEPHHLSPADALELVGLGDVGKQVMGTLSGGQRRRLDLAAAVVGQPELLILDEPTTGLDLEARQQFHRIIQDRVDEGVTVLMTTHDMAEAQDLADRVLILNHGHLVASGSPQQLRDELLQPTQITWFEDGKRQVHATDYPEVFLKSLDLDAITGIEITRPTLGDAYLKLVNTTKETA
ncbi:ABC transporter ATP-binding protein [Stomatohabitans albus]|uniref:ABC transporter ATP-binding protein n=1 Tax=Stomatohabitans albus TaxID=3110766 RepID=UPI00300C7F7F